MKYLVDNKFNDIGAVITNSSKNIDLDIMNTNQKTPKHEAIPISSSIQFFPNSNQILDNENEEEIK